MKYIATLLLAFTVAKAQTQTVHINPLTNGGFETGTSFADNGWTTSDPAAATNKWVIGSNITNPTGAKAAYITSNWSNANPAPGLLPPTTTIFNNLYNTNGIAIPAADSSIILSFKWRARFTNTLTNFFTVRVDSSAALTPPTTTLTQGVSVFTTTTGTADEWVSIRVALAPEFAGKQLRINFVSLPSGSFTAANNFTGVAIDSISLLSRSSGATISSTATGGNWFSPTTWLNGRVPEYFDDVIIAAGSTVTYDRSFVSIVKSMTVNGTINQAVSLGALPTILNNLVVNSTGVANLTSASAFVGLTVGGNIILNANATADFRNTLINSNRTTSPTTTKNTRFEFQNVNQLVGARIAGFNVQTAGTYTIQGAGTLTVSNRTFLVGTLATQGVTLLLNNTVATAPTVATFTTFIGGASNAGYATAPTFASGITYTAAYQHTTTAAAPFIAGSGNEIPANRTVAVFQISTASSFVRLTDDITATSATTPLVVFAPLLVDAGKTIFLTNSTTVSLGNNGNIQGSIQYSIPVVSNFNYTFPVGWGTARRQLSLTGVTTTAASQIRVSTVAAEPATVGAGMGVLTPVFRWRTQIISGTVSNINAVSFEYNAAADGFLAGDTAERRIASSASITGTFDNVGPTTPNSTGVIALPAGNYNQDQFFALGKSSGGFAKTWTGNAGTTNWADAGNWSGNTLPTCTDEVSVAAGFVTITMPALATSGNLNIGQLTTIRVATGNTLTVGCGNTGGGRLINIGNGLLVVEDGGLVNVNGGIFIPNGTGRFMQSGGIINIDPLAANDTLQTAALQIGTSALPLTVAGNVQLTGGTLRFVDPGKVESIQYFGGTAINTSATAAHTTIFGSTESTQTDEVINGFRVNLVASAGGATIGQFSLGNVVIEGSTTPGRWFLAGGLFATGNLTVNANADYRTSSSTIIAGNFINNGKVLRPNLIFAIPVTNGSSVATSSTPSSYINNGIIQANYSILNTINTAGASYTRGDVLTLQGGTFTTPATYLVRAVNTTGAITSITILNPGSYTVEPTAPFTFTGGSGTGFTATPTTGLSNALVKTGDVANCQVFNDGLILGNNLQVVGTLALNGNRNIVTASSNNPSAFLTLGSITSNPAMAGSFSGVNSSFITTPFRRVILPATTVENSNASLFPVGKNDTRRSIGINYTTAPTAAGFITAEFIAQTPGSVGNLPTDAGSVALAAVAPEGYWRITPSSTLAGGTFNVRASARNFAGLNGGIDHRLVNRTNNTSPWQLTGNHADLGLADTIKRNDVMAFGDYAVAFTNATLPVKINRFSGVRNGSNNQLAWQTAQELNNSHFVVEFSANGQNYTPVGTVQTRALNGTSAQALNYQFTHATPSNAYYRLQQVDKNGMMAYSQVVYLAAKAANTNVQVFPTLVTQQLNVTMISTNVERVQVQIVNATGKAVVQRQLEAVVGANVFAIPVSELVSGTYFVKVITAEGTTTHSIVKQ